VASHNLARADWTPTTILSTDVPAQVAELKDEPGRELQVHGSAQLAQSLLAAGLIDELRLVIAPVVVGNGRRLFPDGGAPAGLRLLRNQTTPGGLAVHVYQPIGLPGLTRGENTAARFAQTQQSGRDCWISIKPPLCLSGESAGFTKRVSAGSRRALLKELARSL
jgi:dihydrofolate reductase